VKCSGIIVGLLGFAASACVTPGEPLSNAVIGPLSTVNGQVAFDHNCPDDRIRLIRTDGVTIDLDVCGQVRRYKPSASGLAGPQATWWDVTSMYPASALPAPLPPKS
jgi:hypothetical protein